MKIIVCIKQVPDTTEVKLDPKTGRLIRDGVPSIINPDDKNALEEALRIKDENPDTTVTVVSMGPPQADVAMREALAMGADEAILISGREFGGSDTWATSYIIATAIKKIPDYDIIFWQAGNRRRHRTGRSPDCGTVEHPADHLRSEARYRRR